MAGLTFTNAATNIVLDGNSIIAGSQLPNQADWIGQQLMLLAPINGAMTYKNVAMGGATFKTMVSGTDYSGVDGVNAAYEAGKQNILIAMEGCNTVNTLRPGGAACVLADVVQDCKDYLAAVKAGHADWRIFLLISPAFQANDATATQQEAVLDQWNDYLRNNWQSLGIEGVIETRPAGGALAYSPPYVYSETTFTKSPHYIDGTHLSRAGNAIFAQYIANTLAAAPAVAPAAVDPAAAARRILFASAGKPLLVGGKVLPVAANP